MNKIYVLEIDYFRNERSKIHPVLIEDDKNLCLIDCGFIGSLPHLQNEVSKLGIDFNKLNQIIITHHDHDHMGTLAELKKINSNLTIISSEVESKYISGELKSLRLEQAEKLQDSLPEDKKSSGLNFQELLKSLEYVKVDMFVKDKSILDIGGGVEVITTPGHMPGHISIYIKEFKTLVTGDALTVVDNKLEMANPQFTLNLLEAKKSAEKFLNYDIEKIVCYHGGVFEGNIKESLKNII